MNPMSAKNIITQHQRMIAKRMPIHVIRKTGHTLMLRFGFVDYGL
jgi:hypothetical protein